MPEEPDVLLDADEDGDLKGTLNNIRNNHRLVVFWLGQSVLE